MAAKLRAASEEVMAPLHSDTLSDAVIRAFVNSTERMELSWKAICELEQRLTTIEAGLKLLQLDFDSMLLGSMGRQVENKSYRYCEESFGGSKLADAA